MEASLCALVARPRGVSSFPRTRLLHAVAKGGKRLQSSRWTGRSSSLRLADLRPAHAFPVPLQCWYGKNPDLSRGKVYSAECDLKCYGSKTWEKCGGYDRMTVYEMK